MRMFDRRSFLAATGAAALAGRISDPAFAAAGFDQRFGLMRDQHGWGGNWFAPHYALPWDVDHGHGRLYLPPGLPTSAHNQPVPVFLLDHECADGTQEMRFRVTNTGLRPGLLFRRWNNSHFLAVTVEGHELILASYRRTARFVLARTTVPTLGPKDHMLR